MKRCWVSFPWGFGLAGRAGPLPLKHNHFRSKRCFVAWQRHVNKLIQDQITKLTLTSCHSVIGWCLIVKANRAVKYEKQRYCWHWPERTGWCHPERWPATAGERQWGSEAPPHSRRKTSQSQWPRVTARPEYQSQGSSLLSSQTWNNHKRAYSLVGVLCLYITKMLWQNSLCSNSSSSSSSYITINH